MMTESNLRVKLATMLLHEPVQNKKDLINELISVFPSGSFSNSRFYFTFLAKMFTSDCEYSYDDRVNILDSLIDVLQDYFNVEQWSANTKLEVSKDIYKAPKLYTLDILDTKIFYHV